MLKNLIAEDKIYAFFPLMILCYGDNQLSVIKIKVFPLITLEIKLTNLPFQVV